jgi:hypothetical protein
VRGGGGEDVLVWSLPTKLGRLGYRGIHRVITRCSLVSSGMEKEREDSRGTQGGGTEVDDDCGWLTATVLVHTALDSSVCGGGSKQQLQRQGAATSLRDVSGRKEGKRWEKKRQLVGWAKESGPLS